MKKKYSTNALRAKKSLGQNFLTNKGVVDKIINAAELNSNDLVVEIGPGTGNLTSKLAEKAGRVIAIEKDSGLISELKNKYRDRAGIEIIEEDVLKLTVEDLRLKDSGYKIVANIPYYITSNFIRTVFEKWPKPELIVLMVQKEVAQRIMAKSPPKNGKAVSGQAPMNLLALSVQFYAEPKIISYVSRGSFRPIPKVDSAIISLRPRVLNLKPELKKEFFKLIRTAFAGKRKQLKNTVGPEVLAGTDIKPESRPGALSLDDWLKLASVIK
jgi:16S rRNA (adenine1518-N6/adenine1519-N6)-dimethyltransferase